MFLMSFPKLYLQKASGCFFYEACSRICDAAFPPPAMAKKTGSKKAAETCGLF